ncbi:molybdenum cofactor guanylyltransferase MobA [Pontibacterium granulatum]|uniref:molybdenum cofactor guanylyltransferase MobA n=1 Tax=Pontibacterium granulatum TaxID=2036029 RepID=UPI00249BE374|nr:molybdenum cofactor guanylyltransferase MobA [Pontibacterium granulatum]MDI3326429.1 molybdenum cofactor guanylyltransferase MobA [Pontibacterium granulatum]
MSESFLSIAAVILAGGQGSRMGGEDKGLVPFRQGPMIRWTLDRVLSQVDEQVISCNRNRETYDRFGVATVTDDTLGFVGPLAGVQAAMNHLDGRHSHLLVLPCDTPLISEALIGLLIDKAKQQPDAITLLYADGRPQFLHAVIPVQYHANLDAALESGQRAVFKWYKQFPIQTVEVENHAQCLVNMNTFEHLSLSA